MVSRQQRERVENILVHINELEILYTKYGITNFEQVYLLLSSDDFFTKYVMMNLILIGENSKKINKAFENIKRRRRLNTLETTVDNLAWDLRDFRNKVAHEYYNIETDAIFEVLYNLREGIYSCLNEYIS